MRGGKHSMRKEQFWWIDEGYFPFDAGNDAYPCPGQVVQQYRIRKFVDGRPLRQSDLACMLCITERAVWAMEHTNEGLDSFQRRVELALLLDIPRLYRYSPSLVLCCKRRIRLCNRACSNCFTNMSCYPLRKQHR